MLHDEFQIPAMPKAINNHMLFAKGFLPALFGGLAAGAASALLTPKAKDPKLLQSPSQVELGGKMVGPLGNKGVEFLDKGTAPYAGDMTAPLSEQEVTGLKSLGEYLDSPSPVDSNLFGMTTDELEKTLEGTHYDPATGPYYQAYRTSVMRELKQAKDRLAARSSARDNFFGGGRLDQERELEEGAVGNLTQTLGQLTAAERQNRLNAIPTALNQMGWAENLPLSRIGASQQYGSLPRQVEQQELNVRYQDFVRQLQNMGVSMQAAVGIATGNPQYWMPTPPDNIGMASGIGSLAYMAMMNNNNQSNTIPANTGGMIAAPQNNNPYFL